MKRTRIPTVRHAPAALALAFTAAFALAACSEDEPETTAEAPPAAAPADTAEAPATPETVAAAPAPCGDYDFAAEFFAAYEDATPLADTGPAIDAIQTVAAGECQQDRFITLMREERGPPIGYKVGLVSRAAQEQFGLTAPLVGVFFDGMLLADGATIAVSSGARLGFELDLLARVADEAINGAETVADVLANIDAVYPFIEVPDLMVGPGSRLTGPLVIAMNVAPRYGVMGPAIPVENTLGWMDALGAMEVTLLDGEGTVLVEGSGGDLAGHPLNTALYLIAQANRRGWHLEAGDLLSLGSFGSMQPAQPGVEARARYEGLPSGPAEVVLRFE